MSDDYTVYAKGDAEDIKSTVERWMGVKFEVPKPSLGEGVFHSEWFSVPITFEVKHDMLDDSEIIFSDYPVAIEFRRSASQQDALLREHLCKTLALLLGRRLYSEESMHNIVVENSQQVVARNE